ncbi:1,3-beta-glucanosyltransferase gel2 [Endocarpon pusillum Z07020]|uniref:1,3-beta-glucanosyltransferase n=1 Tax=Endocarpon pusillum (strain Z07020 / HMAS-L-300199) TaxID=1263415 RepID=U1FVU3_ENDPU|nr:1,3-beta-glucanosyltransferase gel2 [Endocarpon pusillum Z07020]ERF68957.1 1,3-beta-glucanosyltransferase gel2 [Endocarpon pusillum Z07020]
MAPMKTALFSLATLLLPSVVQAVQPIEVQGSEFINSVSGKRFQMIGVAYQPGGSSGFNPEAGTDPLSDANICRRDAALMQRLGVNTLRVYNLNPDVNHDECASIFNAAGIYMILDVNSPLPNQSLNRGAPWESYSSDYLARVFQVVENFKAFPNLLGFFSGNEVINEESVVEVPGYIRAVTRDLKDYIAKQADRPIPVGYSAADVRPMLPDTAAYLSCAIAEEASSKIDLFGLNSYSWCGDASFDSSGYDTLVADFNATTIPIFFSEYGCIEVKPRLFTEVAALYSDQMTGVFSGGLIYEYTQEENNYGLVEFNDNNTASLLGDYDTLQRQFAALDFTKIQSADASATALTPEPCSAELITGAAGNFSTNFTLPSRPSGVDDMINNGVPNAKTGRLVEVTETSVGETVYDSSGNPIQGLAVNVLADDQSNTPGSATGSSSGANPSQTGAAPRGGWMDSAVLIVGALTLLAALSV